MVNGLGNGMGSRCKISLFNLFFICLTRMKNGGACDFLASIFYLKVSRFQRAVPKFIDVLSPIVFKHMATAQEKF